MRKFRHLTWMMVAAAGLILSASQSHAQKPDVGDQPGLLPDESVQLDPEWRKTAVLYRTNEAQFFEDKDIPTQIQKENFHLIFAKKDTPL